MNRIDNTNYILYYLLKLNNSYIEYLDILNKKCINRCLAIAEIPT